MGNFCAQLGCSARGEQLMVAARDGDLEEVTKILKAYPRAARYVTFGVRNSPLHFAASRGYLEILNLLLQNGAEVDIRNYQGQTALMHACRCGHWQVVQVLLLHKAKIDMFDFLTGRMPIHYAAGGGHVQCVRLLLADYIPSNFEPVSKMTNKVGRNISRELRSVVNSQADCGITALHFAALHGYAETVQLLLDVGADVQALTGQAGMQDIDFDLGADSTPLHYAACSGSLVCCQALLARGASRDFKNQNGWTAQHVSRLWKRHNLEELLSSENELDLPDIAPSRYLALPLMSIVHIARETTSQNVPDGSQRGGVDACGVCFERCTAVASSTCGHKLCVPCAIHLCIVGSAAPAASAARPPVQLGAIPCPFCRRGVVNFVKLDPNIPVLPEAPDTDEEAETLDLGDSETIDPEEVADRVRSSGGAEPPAGQRRSLPSTDATSEPPTSEGRMLDAAEEGSAHFHDAEEEIAESRSGRAEAVAEGDEGSLRGMERGPHEGSDEVAGLSGKRSKPGRGSSSISKLWGSGLREPDKPLEPSLAPLEGGGGLLKERR